MEHYKVHITHDDDMYINLYSIVEQQIRADAILSREIYEEEWKQFEKIENKRPSEYHFDSINRQSIPNQNKVVSNDREDSLEYLKFLIEKKWKHLVQIGSHQKDRRWNWNVKIGIWMV